MHIEHIRQHRSYSIHVATSQQQIKIMLRLLWRLVNDDAT